MLVTTIAITAVIAIALVGWRVVKGDSGPSSSAPGEWERIALVNRTTGGVTTIDESGEVVAEIVGFGRATEVHSHGTRVALVGAEQITIVDVDDPSAEPVLIPIGPDWPIVAPPEPIVGVGAVLVRPTSPPPLSVPPRSRKLVLVRSSEVSPQGTRVNTRAAVAAPTKLRTR